MNPVVTRSLEPLAFHPCLRLKSAFDGFAVAMRRLHIPDYRLYAEHVHLRDVPPHGKPPPDRNFARHSKL